MTKRALIAGAGVAGLTCALALAREGFEVAVYERAARIEEFGAGIQISPNAARVLERLDALEGVEARAEEPSEIRISRGRDDAILARLPLSDARKRWGAPYLTLHRADLIEALSARIAREKSISVHVGVEVAGLASDDQGVAVGLKRGLMSLRATGDLLIGADGLRSQVRERLGFGKREEARYSGRLAFRALARAEDVDANWREGIAHLRLGPKAHLVHYPLRGGTLVNLVAVIEHAPPAPDAGHAFDGEGDPAKLNAAFARWSPGVRALLSAGRNWRAWPLFHRDPIPAFHRDRVALAGDAAHAMLPFLAQGAAQAIEDAGALSACVGANADVEKALEAYSRHRVERACRVQREALAQARIYHLAGPAALVRDCGMRMLGPKRLMQRNDWIYKV